MYCGQLYLYVLPISTIVRRVPFSAMVCRPIAFVYGLEPSGVGTAIQSLCRCNSMVSFFRRRDSSRPVHCQVIDEFGNRRVYLAISSSPRHHAVECLCTSKHWPIVLQGRHNSSLANPMPCPRGCPLSTRRRRTATNVGKQRQHPASGHALFALRLVQEPQKKRPIN